MVALTNQSATRAEVRLSETAVVLASSVINQTALDEASEVRLARVTEDKVVLDLRYATVKTNEARIF